jgi:hypothetical protein
VSEPAAAPHAPPAVPLGSLTSALQEVKAHAAGGSLSIGEAVEVLRERGLAMVMVVLTLPFLIPVPLVGLSTPVGGAIGLYGLCLALQKKPWLPKWVTRRQMSAHFVERLVSFGSKWARRFEYFMRPRLKFMTWRGADTLIGICLIISSLFLALPLPIPFTNAMPAVAILLLLLGLIERDGVFVLVGQLISLMLLAIMIYCGYLITVYGVHDTWQFLEQSMGRGPATQPH